MSRQDTHLESDRSAGPLARDRIESLLGDSVLGWESHATCEAVLVRPDELPEVLARLRDRAGLDHLAAVTAQEYHDRYESIYQLRSYDDPTHRLDVVVPTATEEPVSTSAAGVFETARWHEREAYDLVGIEYENHPDLRRILLPETWQGHPLSMDYDQDEPQIVPLREHADPMDERRHTDRSDTMFVNIGPHHPATHGVLHLKTVLDGEQVVDVEPDIGYLHRCEEQICQQSTYRHQIMPYPDRWDYVSAGILNEWAYARTVETLADIDVPAYAQTVRTMAAELSRIAAHLLAIGTYGIDVYGDFTAIFMYAITDREKVQKLLEELTGQRLMFNYLRLGGLAWDLPDPREQFLEQVRSFLAAFPDRLAEFEDMIAANELFRARTVGVGELEPETARSYGCTGPVARASGLDYDLRRDDPYGIYDELDWAVVTDDAGDNYARAMVRLRELEQSARIVEQCVDRLEDWPADERTVQANVPRTLKPDPGQEIYQAVEAAKGELGIYIRTDGTEQPARFKIRSPAFSNLHSLEAIAQGEYVPDMIAALGSLDVVLGEVDR